MPCNVASLPVPGLNRLRPQSVDWRSHIATLLDDRRQFAALLHRIERLTTAGVPVCLAASEFGRDPVRAWQAFCDRLADGLRRRTYPLLTTLAPANVMPPLAYWLIAETVFGPGERYLALDEPCFRGNG